VGATVELRHLDTLRAIAEEGSFTAAAESRNTVQSNVSEQIRQLEQELGVQLVRRGGRKGAALTECGEIVVERARRIGLELDALRADLSMLQELQTGDATFGVVGTASRWLVPSLVADLSRRASGVHLRVTEGASERLAAQVANQEMAQAVVTEPVTDHRLVLEHLLDEELVGIAPDSVDVGPEPVPLSRLAELNIVLPPIGNPLRTEVESAAALAHVRRKVLVEVDGVRLIADMVTAGVGAAVLPATALPEGKLPGVRRFTLAGLPPRRLALIVARDAHLSLADQAVRASVLRLVAAHNSGTRLA
jgi:DNA-binding transcriptional LysR family regulator